MKKAVKISEMTDVIYYSGLFRLSQRMNHICVVSAGGTCI